MRTHCRRQGWDRVWQCVGAVTVLGYLLTIFTPLPNWLFDELTTPSMVRPADAVVVLGAGIGEDGVLSQDSLRRAVQGILLWRSHQAPVLVFSGPSLEQSPIEAEVRATMAKAFGVAPEAIVTETTAKTTREEALRIGAELRPRQARRILLVTDSMHMRRAQGLFEAAGFEVLPASADSISGKARSPEGRLQLLRWVLGETVARVYYRLAGYL